ncbi:Periplasmic glycine betaine choline-binding (lipo)protein of an ABC-type transport system [Limosilactobacillus secaliphilus]|uniref:Periplasmic glycine betaine choline-binding (Lipo)protein of an ABC-type transport system n=1 Tax=Limosilactobacillus secaliphilus TaxID=396268 RepID=A0A0R2HZU0_9LACO|nr:Periplasmic glycine betaine choline-binding (lipo)protein of an ABC-type transport system [Limosilactobacillus secaliphilus]
MIKKHRFLTILMTLLAVCSLSACGKRSSHGKETGTVRIASVSSTESQIMANILAQLIEHDTGLKTKIIGNLGSSTVCHKALQRNNADIMATSYTGTDLTGTLGEKPEKDPKKATKKVDRLLLKRYNEVRFPTYGFADTYAFLVTQEQAKKYNLNTVSDLAPYAKNWNAGVDSSWMNRKGDGYKNFKEAYGFDFKRVYPMQIGLVYDAAQQGKMQAILGYSTDGRIKSYHLKVLQDNRHFFPPYEAAAVANQSILKKYPKLAPTIHKLDGQIDLKTMQTLNYEVDDQLLEPATVAHNFLKAHHYFDRR